MAGREKWVEVKTSNVKYYEELELYYRNPAGNIVLYKPEGMSLDEVSTDSKFIDSYFVKRRDRLKCMKAAHAGFKDGLEVDIANKNTVAIKESLVGLVAETFSQPRDSGLEMASSIVDTVIQKCSAHPGIMQNLAILSFADYTTVLHSVNVMLLTLNYCVYNGLPGRETRQLGVAGLLHDLGKTEIPVGIINANRRLTDTEYKEMRTHPVTGMDILVFAGIDVRVALEGALDHHEKLDGSGYPAGKTEISECGKLLGIIDSYEVMTNNSRPHRSSLAPIEVLKRLKEEVADGKYDKKIFESFAYSLTERE